MFNIANINYATTSEGPNVRCVIWFQGCDINCFNCINPELQKFEPVHVITLEELLLKIDYAVKTYQVEGVTYLGGEPTLQIGLVELSKRLKSKNIGIVLFTGKTIDQIEKVLIENVDIIIDGPYVDHLKDRSRSLIGSENQNVYYCSNRYNKNWEKQSIKRIDMNIRECIMCNGEV